MSELEDPGSVEEDPEIPPAVRQRLEAALARLPVPERGFLQARFFEELSVEEIARRHSVSPSVVRVFLFRGFRALRKAVPIDPS